MKPAAISVLGVLFSWGFVGTALSCPKTFGASTLKGSYIMTIDPDNRSNLTNDPSSPGAVLGLLTFDGKGNVTSGTATTTSGPTTAPVTGTYVVNSNGTGTVTIESGPNPPFDSVPDVLNLVLDDSCGQRGDFLDLDDVDNYWDQGALIERTGSRFANSDLMGTYIVKESGLNTVVTGLLSFNGLGAFTGNVSELENTGYTSLAISGTYSINSNGTGQVLITPSSSGLLERSWQVILADTNGQKVFFINTDQAILEGGQPSPTLGGWGTIRKQTE